MIITILSEPRSGSTNLTNWFYFNKKFRKVFLILFITLLPLWMSSTLMLSNYGLNSRVRAHYLLFLIPIIAAYFGELSGHGFNRKADNFKRNLKSKTFSKKLIKEDRKYQP